MCGGRTFIQQEFPDYQYSRVNYQMSEVDGEFAVAEFTLADQNAKGVLVTGIQWDLIDPDTVLEAPVTFYDNQDQAILIQNAKGGYNIKSYFCYYMEAATRVNIKCDNPNVVFIVEYQFLTLPEYSEQEIDV